MQYIPFPQLRRMYRQRRERIEAAMMAAILMPATMLVVFWMLF